MHDFAGKRVTVMGLGRFGGGAGVARWLCDQGARVLLTDRDSADQLAPSLAPLRPLIDAGAITLRLGLHDQRDFRDTDLVIANPAVPTPWNNPYLNAASGAGVPISTEIALLLQRLPAQRPRTIAITGSVGKSTTSAMIHHALNSVFAAQGVHVALGGNIGGSLLTSLAPRGPIDASAFVVLELSSFMLHWIEAAAFAWAPGVAVVTNIAPNHLDWHGDFAHYLNSKQHLVRHQRSDDTAILGAMVRDWRAITSARSLIVDPLSFSGRLSVPGAHNRANAAAALAACVAAAPNVDPARFTDAIAGFSGLEHRLQLVARRALHTDAAPVMFYNDSKSTTPEATQTAVHAVAETVSDDYARIHLIAGGYDKGADLSSISALAARLAGLYTMGATGPSIARASSRDGSAIECHTLERAVAIAAERARPGDAVLLSPGCASWDQYTNFEARGAEFVALVSALGTPGAVPA